MYIPYAMRCDNDYEKHSDPTNNNERKKNTKKEKGRKKK